MNKKLEKNQIDQNCPFCKTSLKNEAIACIDCGATKVTRGDTLSPMQSLMRGSFWINIFGTILFASLLVAYNLAFGVGFFSSSKFNTAKIHESENLCLFKFSLDYEKNKITKQLLATKSISNPCESYNPKMLEIEKNSMLRELQMKEEIKSSYDKVQKGVGSNFQFLEAKTGTLPTKITNPMQGGWLLDIGLALLTLVVGYFIYRLASQIWRSFFGNILDPVWVKRVN